MNRFRKWLLRWLIHEAVRYGETREVLDELIEDHIGVHHEESWRSHESNFDYWVYESRRKAWMRLFKQFPPTQG